MELKIVDTIDSLEELQGMLWAGGKDMLEAILTINDETINSAVEGLLDSYCEESPFELMTLNDFFWFDLDEILKEDYEIDVWELV